MGTYTGFVVDMPKVTLEYISPDKLEPYSGNPRSISQEGLDRIQASISGFGFVNPVIAWRNNGLPQRGDGRK